MRRIDERTFWLPAVLTVLVTLIGAIWPQKLEKAMDVALNWCTTYMGWLYVLGTFALVIFCIGVCVSRYGRIRLGGRSRDVVF